MAEVPETLGHYPTAVVDAAKKRLTPYNLSSIKAEDFTAESILFNVSSNSAI